METRNSPASLHRDQEMRAGATPQPGGTLVGAARPRETFGWLAVALGLGIHLHTVGCLLVCALLSPLHWASAVVLAFVAAPLVALGYRGLDSLAQGAAHDDISPSWPVLNDALGDYVFAIAVGRTVEGVRAAQVARRQAGPFQGVEPGPAPSAGASWPVVMLVIVGWQVLMVILPLATVVGLKAALFAYLMIMPAALMIFFTILRHRR